MGALQIEVDHHCRIETQPVQHEDKEQYSFTIIVMNKFTGEVIETMKYKQVVITLEERKNLEDY